MGTKKKKRFADGSLRALITCNVFRVVHKEDEKKNHRGSVYGVKGAVKLSVFFFIILLARRRNPFGDPPGPTPEKRP